MINTDLHIVKYYLRIFGQVQLLFFVLSSTVIGQVNQSGNLVDLIRNIKDAMPGNGSNAFVIPSNSEMSLFQTIVSDLRQKNYSVIQAKIASVNYEFLKFTDTPTNKIYYILKEKSPIIKGWGTYIYYANGKDSLSIQVPHPIWDTNSWLLGIKAFARSNATWFLMAGTHRYANSDTSSDVAHVTQAVFHALHKTIATPVAIQVHGYSRSNSIYTGYPDIIISNGTLYPPSSLFDLKTKFETKGFSTGVFSFSTYSNLWRLGATTNTQGQWSNSNGKLFIHIEFEYFIRTSDTHTDNAVLVLQQSYGTLTSITDKVTSTSNQENKYQINQNYPNPFNNSTILTFEISEPLQIEIKVFNSIGEVVYTELKKDYGSGTHNIRIDLTNSKSGVYFAQVKSNKFTESKKITLLK